MNYISIYFLKAIFTYLANKVELREGSSIILHGGEGFHINKVTLRRSVTLTALQQKKCREAKNIWDYRKKQNISHV